MIRRTVGLVWTLAAAMALFAGCSGSRDNSTVSPTGPKVRQQLSPPVEQPRDIRAYGARPCEVFTVEQLKGFGFDLPPHRMNTLPSGHKTCAWIDSSRNGELVISTYPDWDVLERTYAQQAALPVFEPLQIGGTPAVVYQVGAVATCEVTVGLAKKQGLDVRFTDLRQPYEDPCGAARAAAEVAVGNLPPLG